MHYKIKEDEISYKKAVLHCSRTRNTFKVIGLGKHKNFYKNFYSHSNWVYLNEIIKIVDTIFMLYEVAECVNSMDGIECITPARKLPPAQQIQKLSTVPAGY